MLTCFGMIWNYNKFSRQNTWNSYKNNALSNFYLLKFDSKKKKIGATINTINRKFQNISFENSSSQKHVFLVKGL
jgi:hypothetical protein